MRIPAKGENMVLIEWDENMSVGIPKIDSQHKQLVKMINDLNSAMREGKSKDVLGGVVAELMKYAQVHFQTEEEYFLKYSYKDREAHEREHFDFITRVFDFKKKFDANEVGLSIEIMHFLSNWLVNHIRVTDMKFKGVFV